MVILVMSEQKKPLGKISSNHELLFKAILDSAYFAIVATDRDGYIVYINEMAKRLMGVEREIKDNPVHYSEISHDIWGDLEKIIDTGEPQIGIPVANDNSLLVNRNPINWDGEVIGVMIVFQRKEEYEKVSHYLSGFQDLLGEVNAIINSSYDGIYVTDGKANTIRINKAYEDITGIRASEVLGRNMRDLVKEGYFSESATLQVLDARKSITVSQQLKSGKRILVTGNPFFDDNGEIKMVVTNVRDMSNLDRLSHELEGTMEMTRVYRDKLQEFQLLAYKDNEIIRVSKAMKSIYNLMERVAGTSATVLLLGETGVGKDRIAEEIHARSDRAAKGIFVKINCGAIPETLLESELFGYEKGAFTGAGREGKPGLFEVADKGTLFLDEVEAMPLAIQGKLLRVLQDFEITRVGGVAPKKVDVRLVCASNQDLQGLVREKKFRTDLYYRLNVIPVYIPPLRERVEDIPHLIMIFLNRLNKQYSKEKVFSSRAIDKLVKYSWPGNVREMINMIERLVVVVPGNLIDINDLPSDVYQVSEYNDICQGTTLKEYLHHVEMSVICNAINKYGNARRAAPHLGVNPSTLTRKLKTAQ